VELADLGNHPTSGFPHFRVVIGEQSEDGLKRWGNQRNELWPFRALCYGTERKESSVAQLPSLVLDVLLYEGDHWSDYFVLQYQRNSLQTAA